MKQTLWLSKCAVWVVLCLAFPVISQAETYSYDVTGRLTGVTYDDVSSITYTYDAAGNRLSRIVSAQAVCSGDFNNDGDVDGHDLADFVFFYAGQQTEADLNGDTFFNSQDIQIFADEFGKTDCLIAGD